MDSLINWLWQEHRGKTVGVILGLVASILFVTLGFWRTIFIIICLSIGYYIGKRVDEHHSFNNWLETFKNQR
ncbi:MAG: DUF2273 domain-containing protein [Syntrophomonadaceae bacterium]|jgi:uncharacterized membrane protein|nr:DUF2273 domain-containing protein [Syntrophomonadaceae bacterium]